MRELPANGSRQSLAESARRADLPRCFALLAVHGCEPAAVWRDIV